MDKWTRHKSQAPLPCPRPTPSLPQPLYRPRSPTHSSIDGGEVPYPVGNEAFGVTSWTFTKAPLPSSTRKTRS